MSITKWLAVFAAAALTAGAGAVTTAAGYDSRPCLATPVHGNVVKAGPFTGYLARQYDVVAGRFRLHVGPYRNKATGLSQKIPWYAKPESGVDSYLVVTGIRVRPQPARRFKQTSTTGGLFPQGYVFPTSFSPPSAGCWRLTFSSGSATGTLTVLVRG
jgi:hypothetical protein